MISDIGNPRVTTADVSSNLCSLPSLSLLHGHTIYDSEWSSRWNRKWSQQVQEQLQQTWGACHLYNNNQFLLFLLRSPLRLILMNYDNSSSPELSVIMSIWEDSPIQKGEVNRTTFPNARLSVPPCPTLLVVPDKIHRQGRQQDKSPRPQVGLCANLCALQSPL